MEAKLAEFRRSQARQQPWIDWHALVARLRSLVPSRRSHVHESTDNDEDAPVRWSVVAIKSLLWLTLFVIFVRLEFGAIFFILSLFYFIWKNLSSRRRPAHELSAYSVFNRNFEKLQGTFSAEDYDRQLRHGGSPFLSS